MPAILKKPITSLLIVALLIPITGGILFFQSQVVSAVDDFPTEYPFEGNIPATPGPSGGGGMWGWVASGVSCFASGGAACGGLASKVLGWAGGNAVTIGEHVLSAVAKSAKKNILNKLYQNIIDWVADEGGQVLDWDQYREEDVFNEARGLLLNDFVEAKTKLGLDLCNPFDAFGESSDQTTLQLEMILGEKPGKYEEWSCKATAIKDAGKKFFETFEGGWDAWLEVTTQPMANPYGMYLYALDKKYTTTGQLTEDKEKQLAAGKGFLGQEKIFQWHFRGKNTDIIGPIKCPIDINGVTCESIESKYCGECRDDDLKEVGLSPKNIKSWYGIGKNALQPVLPTLESELPARCRKNYSPPIPTPGTPPALEFKAEFPCSLVIDEDRVITPGSIFAEAATRAMFKDIVRVEQAGPEEVSLFEYYTGKLLDDVLSAAITRGYKAFVGDKEKDKDKKYGLHITSRREMIEGTTEKGAFEVFQETYGDTLADINKTISTKQRLSGILGGFKKYSTVKNYFEPQTELLIKAEDLKHCTMNRCVEQEEFICRDTHQPTAGQTDEANVDPQCFDREFATCMQTLDTRQHPPQWCVDKASTACPFAGSRLDICINDGWDYCTKPNKDQEYENPEVQDWYALEQKIYQYRLTEPLEQLVNKVRYGTEKELDAQYLDTQYLDDLDQYIDWEKKFINCIQAAGYPLCDSIKLDTGNTERYESALDWYYGTSGRLDEKITTQYWEDKFKQTEKERRKLVEGDYSLGLEGLRELRKRLENEYEKEISIFLITEDTAKDYDIENLTDKLLEYKNAKALKAYELENLDTDDDRITLEQELENLSQDLDALQQNYNQRQSDIVWYINFISSKANLAEAEEELETAKQYTQRQQLDELREEIEAMIDTMRCVREETTMPIKQ